MRLTLTSVQQQAQSCGHSVEKTSKGYNVNGQTFRLLAEVVNYLNTCLETPVTPDLTVNEVQQVAQQMGFLVQPMAKGYGIFFEGQLLGVAKLLREVMQVLPEYKEAIEKYQAEQNEPAVARVELDQHVEITTESVNNSTVVYALGSPIAAIANNPENYLPWAVMVGGVEIHTCKIWQLAYRYIVWHYKQGTLPVAQPQPIDEQAVAQFELDAYIQDQAEDIAPQIQVLEQHGDEYVVANLDNGNHYVVCPSHPDCQMRCECPHCYYRGARCKHQQAVEKLASKKNKSAVAVTGIVLSAMLANPLTAVASNTYDLANNDHPDCTYRGAGRREDCVYVSQKESDRKRLVTSFQPKTNNQPAMNKYYFYENCEIKYNIKTDEYLAFDEDGEEGSMYLGGGRGTDGEQKAKKAIDDYLKWKNSFVNAVDQRISF